MKTLSILMRVALFIAIFAGCCRNEKTTKVEDQMVESDYTNNYILESRLTTADYSEYEGYFPEEGFISTAEIAFQVAESILNKIYGKGNIEEQKPFSINLENDIWIVKGTLYSRKGGVAYMEIRKNNGEILKVHHGR